MLDLIDPATILAYQYVAWARAYLDNVVQEYAPLARAMAVNDVSDTPNAGRDVFARIEELAGHWGAAVSCPHVRRFSVRAGRVRHEPPLRQSLPGSEKWHHLPTHLVITYPR